MSECCKDADKQPVSHLVEWSQLMVDFLNESGTGHPGWREE